MIFILLVVHPAFDLRQLRPVVAALVVVVQLVHPF
jgi:hypothetical protein